MTGDHHGIRAWFLLLVSLLIAQASVASAADEFEVVGFLRSPARSWLLQPDSRSAAMGGAYTAVAEGAAASWWNLGALPLLDEEISASFSTRKMHPAFGDSRFDFLQLAGRTGAFGFG